MASSRSSFFSTWWSPSSPSLNRSTSLASPATTAPVPSPPTFETGLSPSTYEPTMTPEPQFSPMPFDYDQIMDDFSPVKIVDYHEMQRGQVVSPSPSSNELVLNEPKTQPQENIQERLGQVVKGLVQKEVDELMKQAKADSGRTSVEETSELAKEDGKLKITAAEKAQADHESPKITNMEPTFTTRPGRSATKQVAHISNVSFQIPDDPKVDNDTVNEFVPEDEVLREITAQSRKKYSFSDRLHGWKMECRIRLNGVQQFDKYFTHVESKIVTRSVPEVVRFILYEVNPKQMKEANSKRKGIDIGEPADERPKKILKDEYLNKSSEGAASNSEEERESYDELFFRVAWSNLINDAAEKVPLFSEWEKSKAAKKKARTKPCEPEVGTPNLDIEALETANALMGLAEDENLDMRKSKACNDRSGFGVFIRKQYVHD